MHDHTTVFDLLCSAMVIDNRHDIDSLSTIDAGRYRQARELAYTLGIDWRSILLDLWHRHGTLLIGAPAAWFFASNPETWDREARLFACDCAERVLPCFEQLLPENPHPRQTIDAARKYALGQALPQKLAAYESEAQDAAGDVRKINSTAAKAAGRAAKAAGWAAAENPRKASYFAARQAVWVARIIAEMSAEGNPDSHLIGRAARLTERRAQWELLVERLCGRSPRPLPA